MNLRARSGLAGQCRKCRCAGRSSSNESERVAQLRPQPLDVSAQCIRGTSQRARTQTRTTRRVGAAFMQCLLCGILRCATVAWRAIADGAHPAVGYSTAAIRSQIAGVMRRLSRRAAKRGPKAKPSAALYQSSSGRITFDERPSSSTSRIVSALLRRISAQASGVWKALCGVMITRPSSQASLRR